MTSGAVPPEDAGSSPAVDAIFFCFNLTPVGLYAYWGQMF